MDVNDDRVVDANEIRDLDIMLGNARLWPYEFSQVISFLGTHFPEMKRTALQILSEVQQLRDWDIVDVGLKVLPWVSVEQRTPKKRRPGLAGKKSLLNVCNPATHANLQADAELPADASPIPCGG
eukprot:gnl/MRDRNA2_/MRDRNA2_215349_c0_seq1.p1 gnl/MRDRNA2_/MRDRNA2_215349_c0~~gnl/MRDRNA2_/MRDRNA2_215349_c0_seq1.p1  ORF type:complete len:136 (+),score=23.60 gnl/MRDRNA2_/MRDRNA2_215349_c0_seq1:35-409(+)